MKQIAIACEDDTGLEGEVSAHFGRCPYYAVVTMEGAWVMEHRVEKNPHFGRHQPGLVPDFIRSLGADAILAGGMGPRAIDLFHRFGIDVVTGVAGKVGEAVDEYAHGRLTGIVPCRHDHPDSCGGSGQDRSSAPTHSGGGEAPASTYTEFSRLAVPANDESGLSALMDPRFGRAQCFLVVDVESGEVVQTINNDTASSAHGAGIGAAGLIARAGVDVVVAGRFGPKAEQALRAAGIELRTAPEGLTVGQILDEVKGGALSDPS
jgi:predicted Fe-Mo cluster-binding NifX family protein